MHSTVSADERTNTDAMIPPEEAAVIARAQAGDVAAFEDIVHRYSGRVHHLVSGILRNRYDVEDAVQEVFFKVHRKIAYFEGKSSFYTWLYRVAFNTATDYLKRKKWRPRAIEDMPGYEPVAQDAGASSGSDRSELRRRLAEAMAELPENYRDILVLREYEEFSYEDIAKTLNIALGTVESRLFRARARLKEKMKKYVDGKAV